MSNDPTFTDADLRLAGGDPEVARELAAERATAEQHPTEDLIDEQILAIVNRYHEIARGNGALELVATEIAGPGFFEIVDETLDVASELGFRDVQGRAWEKLRDAVRNYGTRLAAEIAASKLEPGEKVRILTASEDVRLGAMLRLDDTKFVGTVTGGTVGTFRGMHPNEQLSGWALVDVPATDVELAEGWTLEELGNPETLVAPVHAAAVERVQ